MVSTRPRAGFLARAGGQDVREGSCFEEPGLVLVRAQLAASTATAPGERSPAGGNHHETGSLAAYPEEPLPGGSTQSIVVLALWTLLSPGLTAQGPASDPLLPAGFISVPFPYDVALGDLDENGTLDLVVARSGGGVSSVGVALGNGDGTFGPPTYFAVAAGPWEVKLGDINDDGHLDAVAPSLSGGGVSVLLGLGNGAFQLPHGEFPTGSGPRGVSLGDLNGDGDLDLVAANFAGGTVTRLMGDGLGQFGAAGPVNPPAACWTTTLGDVDDDGDLDVVEPQANNNHVAVFINDGNGGFSAGWKAPAGGLPTHAAIGDVNADGHPDIAIANFSGDSIGVYFGDGAGDFAFGFERQIMGDIDGPEDVTIVDLDQDGLLDIVNPNFYSGKVTVFLAPVFDASPVIAYDTTSGSGARGVATGDLDGDCALDLVVACLNSMRIYVFLSNPASPPPFSDCDLDGVFDGCQLAAGDLDGNGLLDSCESGDDFLVRGDANLDGVVDIGDVSGIIAYMFQGAPSTCRSALDADDSEVISLADAFRVLCHLFVCDGAPPIPAPFPGCGLDPTQGSLGCDTGPSSCP